MKNLGVKSKNIKYTIDLVATDTIEVKVNAVSVFNETIPASFKSTVNLSYNESEV